MSDPTKSATTAGDRRLANPVPNLISRLYRSADLPARAGILATLIKPLGPLGLAAVASGAFAEFVTRRRSGGIEVGLDDAGRYTGEQVLELARFVEQVDADVFQLVIGSVVDSPAGYTAFGVALALLALRWYRGRGGGDERAMRRDQGRLPDGGGVETDYAAPHPRQPPQQ
jgi:hypothetical protein